MVYNRSDLYYCSIWKRFLVLLLVLPWNKPYFYCIYCKLSLNSIWFYQRRKELTTCKDFHNLLKHASYEIFYHIHSFDWTHFKAKPRSNSSSYCFCKTLFLIHCSSDRGFFIPYDKLFCSVSTLLSLVSNDIDSDCWNIRCIITRLGFLYIPRLTKRDGKLQVQSHQILHPLSQSMPC